jgi:hypothetical protein
VTHFRRALAAVELTAYQSILRKSNDNLRIDYFYRHSRFRVPGIFSQSRRRLERRALVMSMYALAWLLVLPILAIVAAVCAYFTKTNRGLPMADYAYKTVRDLLPKHIIDAQGADYEGEANYDGDQWYAAEAYINELRDLVIEAVSLINEKSLNDQFESWLEKAGNIDK